jgi:hypothetical protein
MMWAIGLSVGVGIVAAVLAALEWLARVGDPIEAAMRERAEYGPNDLGDDR